MASDKHERGSDPVSGVPESAPPEQERLDGWKRIARYLNRNVRTLRRWEENEGLPVRRLMHDKLATVYAYRSELDAWLEQREQGAVNSTSPSAGPDDKSKYLWPGLAVMALILAALLAVFWPAEDKPTIAFGEWDWVLITEFENRTDENVLDDTVEYALERELANSSYVKVAPRERINDSLQLMRRPLTDPIDVETGREISLRDGGIRILISGRIEKIGNTYQISTNLINPDDGVTLASFSANAENQGRILPAIAELAHDVRVTLGEGLASIEKSEEMLAKVTTPSLQALRLYSQANVMMAGPDRSQALPVLEEAVRIDPDFASAHLLLSYAYGDLGELDRVRQHLQRAVELADQTTERERLFILATYYLHLEDFVRTEQTYDLLLRLYPDHFWANANVAAGHELMGELEKAYPHKVRGAEWTPNGFWPQYDAAQFAMAVGDFVAANKYMLRARELAVNDQWQMANLIPAAVHEAWVRGDYPKALDELDELVAAYTAEELVTNGQLFGQIRSLYLSLGLLNRFREISASRSQMGWLEAILALDSGDTETLQNYLQGEFTGFWGATLLASMGQSERARKVLADPRIGEDLPPFFFEPDWRNLVEGHIALAEGRYQDAATMLGNHMVLICITAKYAYLFAMNSKSRAYVELGQYDKAIDTLEIAGRQKPLTIFEPGATWMWQRNQLYLHELYLLTGKGNSAERVAAELREVLQLADADHPFLRALDLRKKP